MKIFPMKAFTTIELLVIVVAFIIFGMGSVVVWKKKVTPRSTSIPTPISILSPTLSVFPTSTPTKVCRTDNECQTTPTPKLELSPVPEVTLSPKPTPASKDGCVIWGCNGELCIDSEAMKRDTICRDLPLYECFRTATCERQTDGGCAWTQTPELRDCLSKFEN